MTTRTKTTPHFVTAHDAAPAPAPESYAELFSALFLPIFAPSFVYSLSGGVVLPYVPLYARQLSGTDSLTGFVTSASMAVTTLDCDSCS